MRAVLLQFMAVMVWLQCGFLSSLPFHLHVRLHRRAAISFLFDIRVQVFAAAEAVNASDLILCYGQVYTQRSQVGASGLLDF